MMKFSGTVRTVLAVTSVLTTVYASAQSSSPFGTERWTYSLTPYLWLPTAEGTLKYHLPPGSGSPTVEVDGETLLDALDFGIMLAGEARSGRWSIAGDYIYLKLAGAKASVRSLDFNPGLTPVNPASTAVNTGTESRLKGSIFTLVGGYNLTGNYDAPADVIGGLRYFNLTAATDWRFSAAVAGPGAGQTFPATGSISQSTDLWDAIVGLRGRFRLADRWHLPYHVDIGTGSSSLTWQAVAGLSYAFKWGEVTLTYRHLFYDQKGDKLVQDLTFSGPLIGATFRF